MADRLQMRSEYKDAVPSTRTRSGSEAIRKRVAQLLQDSGTVATTVDSPGVTGPERMPRRNSSSSQPDNKPSREQKPDLRDKRLPGSPANPSRSLKRKKSSGWTVFSDRPENKNSNRSAVNANPPIGSSSRPVSSRAFGALARPPPSDHDSPFLLSQNTGRNIVKRPPSHYRYDSRQSHDFDGVANCTTKTSEDRVFQGPLAAAEYDRMKEEIEMLKEALQDGRKVSKRNAKKLDETKAELNAAVLAVKDKESELATIKDNCRKKEELLSTIESSVQCQICMDLPDNPFALSPCGHVLCLSCLQEWFRKAPPTLDDMDIDPDELTDPHYILMRTKSCPSCRAVVKRRPVPVFMVKAVTAALKKSKPSLPGHLSLPVQDTASGIDHDNPWKGIFPSSEEESPEEDSEYSGDEFGPAVYSDDDEEGHQVLHALYRSREFRRSLFPNISSDSEAGDESDQEDDPDDASDEDEAYVLPRWAPPTVDLDPNEYPIAEMSPLHIKLLQRGCTWEMIDNYDISYSHSSGIIASVRSLDHLYADGSDGDLDIDRMNRVYLGWNVFLQAGDMNGYIFMNDVLEDIKSRPTRWQLTPRRGGHAMDARRLICAADVVDYDTTDTEVWIDAEDF